MLRHPAGLCDDGMCAPSCRDLKAQNVLLDVHGVAKVRHIRNACRNVWTIKRLRSLCLTDTHLFDVYDYAGGRLWGEQGG